MLRRVTQGFRSIHFLTGLAMVWIVSASASAEETLSPVLTKISSTTLSGYVDVTGTWTFSSSNETMPGRTDGAPPDSALPLGFTAPNDLSIVPEPASGALALAGAAAVLRRRRVRRAASR